MLLTLEDVHVHYNKVAALKGISINVEQGDFVTLIGSNGAGKSTTLRVISGLERASTGEIKFKGQAIGRLTPDKILKLGIAHVPEGRRIFKDLTVMENLYLGAFTRTDRTAIKRDLDAVFNHFPRLLERNTQLGRTLSGGEQQMLSIGRALMADPQLLLLDEPSLGLAPILVEEIAKILLEINKREVAIVLVEQNADLALEIARHGYVLETGNIALHGESEGLANNEHVKMAYLGI